jgi:hypothetical protein
MLYFQVEAKAVGFCVTVHSEERVMHSFPGQTMSEWFEGFGGSSLCRGKNESVPEL